MDLNQLKTTYSKLYTAELIKLTKDLDELRPEAIDLLKLELEKRSSEIGLQNIQDYFYQKEEDQHFRENINIEAHVRERVQAGEELESIKYDLRNRGIDLSNEVKEDFNRAEAFLN